MPLHTNHRKGLLITAIGGLVLSFDIPLIRLAYGDPWPILMLRTRHDLCRGVRHLGHLAGAQPEHAEPRARVAGRNRCSALRRRLDRLRLGRLHHLDREPGLHPRLHDDVCGSAVLDLPRRAPAPRHPRHHGGDDPRRADHRLRRARQRPRLRRPPCAVRRAADRRCDHHQPAQRPRHGLHCARRRDRAVSQSRRSSLQRPATASTRRGGSSSTARWSCRSPSSASPTARNICRGRRSRCSTSWKPCWRRSGCG